MQIKQFFLKGLNRTLKLINGTNFSYAGPWTTATAEDTVIDSWFVGDFMSADYTIAVDQSSGVKEIIKCLVVASPQTAALTIYGRTDTSGSLLTLTATVTNSRLFLIAKATSGNSKVVFSANYYQSLNGLTPV